MFLPGCDAILDSSIWGSELKFSVIEFTDLGSRALCIRQQSMSPISMNAPKPAILNYSALEVGTD